MSSADLAHEVTQGLVACAEVLANPREVTPELVAVWTSVLSGAGIAPAEVRPAAARLIATQRFFPSPAEFLAIARPPDDREAAEERAWQAVLAAVRAVGGYGSVTAADFGGDGGLLWAVRKLGWVRLCDQLTEENRALWRAEFVRVFRIRPPAAALPVGDGGYDLGRCERLNGGAATAPREAGRPDWRAAAGLPASVDQAGGP